MLRPYLVLTLVAYLPLASCTGPRTENNGTAEELSATAIVAPAQPHAAAAAPNASLQPTAAARTSRLWSRSCALCHIDGNGGAPRMGNPEEWAPRLERGQQVMLQNTIQGLNNMPPLGYCMACERQDFVALIQLMTAGLPAPTVTGESK